MGDRSLGIIIGDNITGVKYRVAILVLCNCSAYVDKFESKGSNLMELIT